MGAADVGGRLLGRGGGVKRTVCARCAASPSPRHPSSAPHRALIVRRHRSPSSAPRGLPDQLPPTPQRGSECQLKFMSQFFITPCTSRLHESARSWRNGHETAAAAGARGGGLPALVLPASTPQNTALGSLVRHVCPTRRLGTPLSSRSPPPRASSIAILRLPSRFPSGHGQPPPSLVSRGVGRVQGRMCGFAPAHDTHRRCWRPA